MANFPIAPLPFPPREYDPNYLNEVIRNLNLYFRILQNPGQINGATINLSNLPTSSTGLRPGDVWIDTSDFALKIVPLTNYQVNIIGESVTTAAGTVTV